MQIRGPVQHRCNPIVVFAVAQQRQLPATPGAGRLPQESWWLAAEATAAAGAIAAAAWAQLRKDVRVASAAAALLAGGLAIAALHERARRQAAQAEVAVAYAALAAQLARSEAVVEAGLDGVRGEVAAAALPALARQLKALDAKVAALEGSTLSAGRNAQAAAREVAAAAGRMRGEAAAGAASAVAPLRAGIEALAARRGDDGDRVVARLDPRLAGLEAALRDVEAAQSGTARQLPDAIADAVSELEAALSEVVGRQLERGLGPLRQLPGAVAAEVVEEMRATALQRGLQNGGMAAGSSSAGGAFQNRGALMLGDGAQQAWQEAVEQQAAAAAEVRAAAAEVRAAAAAPVTLGEEQWGLLGRRLAALQTELQEMRAGDGPGAARGRDDVPMQDTMATQLAESRALLQSVQERMDSLEALAAAGNSSATSGDVSALQDVVAQLQPLQQAAEELRQAQAQQAVGLAAVEALERRLEDALSLLPVSDAVIGTSASSRSQEAAAAPAGMASPAAESVVAESAFGAASATSSLRGADAQSSGSSSGSRGAVGGSDSTPADGPVDRPVESAADTQEAAYQRMQAVLAAANPTAQPLEDPAAQSGNCLTPSPGSSLQPRSSSTPNGAVDADADAVANATEEAAAGERPFADFLASGPEPPAALSMDAADADTNAAAGSAPAESSGMDNLPADLTASVDYAPEAIEARGADLAAGASSEQWQQQQQNGSSTDAAAAEQAEWASGSGMAQQNGSGTAAGSRDYMAEYQDRYPSAYQEAGFDGGFDGGYMDGSGGDAARDSSNDSGSYEIEAPGRGGDSAAFWPDAAGLGDAPNGTQQDSLYEDSSFRRGSYQEGYQQDGSAYPGESYQDSSFQAAYQGSYQANSRQGSSNQDAAAVGPPPASDDLPAAASAGAPASVQPQEPQEQLQQPALQGRTHARPAAGADPGELVAEGLASLRAGRAAAADGAALGDADRLLRRAAASFEEAAAADPSNLKSLGNWGNALLAHGQVKRTLIEELRNGQQLLPVEQRAVDDAIEALQTEAHDLLVSAGRKFRAVLEADGQQGRALLNWGRVLMLRAELAADDLPRAADLLVSAVAKFEAALACGERSGGRAAGLALAKLAMAAPAGDPSLQATLEDAVAYLRDALQAAPEDEPAAAALRRCEAQLADLTAAASPGPRGRYLQ